MGRRLTAEAFAAGQPPRKSPQGAKIHKGDPAPLEHAVSAVFALRLRAAATINKKG